MDIKYFVSTIHRDNGTYTKGIAIHDTLDAAQQAFHNEFTAWGYGKKQTCDYVCAYINDSNGAVVRSPEVWSVNASEPEPELEPEPEPEPEEQTSMESTMDI